MKQMILALVTLATATQAFASSPRCEKALSFNVYYTVQNDDRSSGVKFSEVQYFQADYSLGGSAGGD